MYDKIPIYIKLFKENVEYLESLGYKVFYNRLDYGTHNIRWEHKVTKNV